jgi:hypothetical protein
MNSKLLAAAMMSVFGISESPYYRSGNFPPRKEISTKIKGAFMGICARRDCHNMDATHWNESTQKYYCFPCAKKINRANGKIVCRRHVSNGVVAEQ